MAASTAPAILQRPFLYIFKDGQLIDTLPLCGKDTFLMGRHADCDVLLTHPSVSRQHLQLQLLHATHEILVTDLSSVHGTWINEQRLEPRCPSTAKVDDTIRLGASSRIYAIRWTTDFGGDQQSDKAIPIRSAESAYSKAGSMTEIFSDKASISSAWIRKKESDAGDEDQENKVSELCTGDGENGSSNSPQISRKELTEVRPPRPPAHRVPFAPLQLAMVSNTIPKSPNVKEREAQKVFVQVGDRKDQGGVTRKQASLNLWLRRCNSAPPPTVQTVLPSAPPMPENEEHTDKMVNQSGMVENEKENRQQLIQLDQGKMALDKEKIGRGTSVSHASSSSEGLDEEFPSDKENMAPSYHRKTKKSNAGSSEIMEVSRRPFQPLFLTSEGQYKPQSTSVSYKSIMENSLQRFGLARPQRRSSSGQTLNQRLKMMDEIELRYHWHIVVDTSCFVNQNSFASLKQLEGIKETRVIIPKIVVRELDSMKRSDMSRTGPGGILKWIEACMVRIPSWIHVQNSSETLPVGVTPPSSPHHAAFSPYGSLADLMSPTNDDHVLECALLFSRTIMEGQVALLTNHTALKIKAMAEGLICESATSFCESLLNPYSERFLWAGSIAHGPTWIERPSHCTYTPTSQITLAENKTLISAAKAIACGKHHHIVEGLKNHCSQGQAQGLRVVLD